MRRALLFMSLLSLLCACKEPPSVETFLPGDGPYVFPVEMADSTASYDFDLYTRIDADAEEIAQLQELPLDVEWKSPSDSSFRERVYLPLSGQGGPFNRDVYHPYRAGMRPVECGSWTLTFRVPADIPRRGMGLVVRKNADRWDTEN